MPAEVSGWRLVWAFVLSIVPGLGHVYARLWRAGLALLAINLVGNAAFSWFTRVVPPTRGLFLIIMATAAVAVVVTLAIAIDAIRRNRTALDRPRPRWFQSTWLTAVAYFAIALAVTPDRGWQSFSTLSTSMEPSMRVGDRWIGTVALQPPISPSRGSIVAFDSQGLGRNQGIFVKRVIGLPGDRVALKGGIVQVNGSPVQRVEDGDYTVQDGGFKIVGTRWIETLPDGPAYPVLTISPRGPLNDMEELTVPPGRMFVLGDNRDNSLDSRVPDLGMVPIDHIVSALGVKYWSNGGLRLFTNP